MHRRLLTLLLFLLAWQCGEGQAWKPLPGAPSIKLRFDDIWFVNDTTGWAVDGKGNIYRSARKGKPWTMQFNTGKYNRSIEFLDDTTGFVGTIDSAVYGTTDGGNHWARIDKRFPHGVAGVCGISHLGDSIIMVGAYFGNAHVLRSFDRGKTWRYTDMSPYCNGLVDAWYQTRDTIFISGNDRQNRGLVMRSADAGATWVTVSPVSVPVSFGWKLTFPTHRTGYLALEEVTLDDHLTGTATRILKTINGGSTWELIDTRVGKNIDIEGLGFLTEKLGWMGGWSTGMYETDDGGMSWRKINNFANLNRFFMLRPDHVFFSGTTIFELVNGFVTAVETPPNKDVHSLDVYPNPGHEESKARLTLGTATMVVLKLQDIMGRDVKEIYRGYAAAGTYDYAIDLKDVPAGRYIVTLLTHQHFIGKRLIKQ